MTITLRGTASANSLTCNKPSNTQAGDFMVATVISFDNTGQTITAPPGWTQRRRVDNSQTTLVVYTKLAAAGAEPVAYIWSSTTTSDIGTIIASYSGVAQTNSWDGTTDTGNSGTGTTSTGLAVTATYANEMLVLSYTNENGTNTMATPGGMAQEVSGTTSGGSQFQFFDQLLSSSGSTGNKSGAVSNSTWATIMGALRPSLTIDTEPVSQKICAGGTATFSVTATAGGGSLSYQWTKNGTNLGGATSSSYTTPTLDMTFDGALYRCVVTDDNGSVTSDPALLNVQICPGMAWLHQ